jgi:hypothetical protein
VIGAMPDRDDRRPTTADDDAVSEAQTVRPDEDVPAADVTGPGAARRKKLREALAGELGAAALEEEQQRERELLRDVPPHHG